MDASTIEVLPSASISSSNKRKHTDCNSTIDDDTRSSTIKNEIAVNTNAKILNLTGRNKFGFEDCAALGKLLVSNNGCEQNYISDLIISRVGIGPRGGAILAESLEKNHTMVHLDLERNGLGTTGGSAIFKALAENNTLRKLNISLNDMKAATSAGNDEATRAIGDTLAVNCTLVELLLVRCGLGPKGGKNVARGLSNNTALLRLDLAGNDIMADGGQAMGSSLETNSTLQDLNLRWNRIGCGGDSGVESVANSLRINKVLLKLDMSVNELYSEGAIAFGAALAANHSLLDLNLERNEIGAAGAIAIAEALKCNMTLQRLVLSGNPMIGDKGMVAIGLSLAVNDESGLKDLELVGCGIGADGAHAISEALKSDGSSLSSIHLERNNIGAIGAAAIAIGLEQNISLQHLYLARNGLQGSGGKALAIALRKNKTLHTLDISYNEIEIDNDDNDFEKNNSQENHLHIIESIVNHPSLQHVDLSNNAFESIPIDCQLKLAQLYQKKRKLVIDLSDNPLSSPPLGRKADVEGLKIYLDMLLSDSTAVNRIRLMVLGFGGVGKSTFCDAMTQPTENLAYFHGSLVPLGEWDFKMIASWARRLGTHWAESIASILDTNKISGKELHNLIVIQKTIGEGSKTVDDIQCIYPSQMLEDLVDNCGIEEFSLTPPEKRSLARAIGSLMRKGYFSTVGAVKMEGLLELDRINECDNTGNKNSDNLHRKCSLVDFAGQMEYLVSHQLLLSSLHTLCVVLQPASSFGYPLSRHSGSWMYWSRFLRALGDRREKSLLLAISQQDRVTSSVGGSILDVNTEATIEQELSVIRSKNKSITESPPLRLDYRPNFIRETVKKVRRALSRAADSVAKDWLVPASYEKLAKLVHRLEEEKKSNREIPILSREELHKELPSIGLKQMYEDPQLFQRGIEYLEAVGDVMADHRLDCLLLDPISWFASFLAHFIRDDDIVTSVQLESRFVKRGVVSLENVVAALQHDYTKPREQVAQVMSLVCCLELCILYNGYQNESGGNLSDDGKPYTQETITDTKADSNDRGINNNNGSVCVCEDSNCYYLFPCLLPLATANEISRFWPTGILEDDQKHEQTTSVYLSSSTSSLVYRGYRFRSRSGFFPPGLFPGLLARCRFLRRGVMSSERMWKNCAVLVFRSRNTKSCGAIITTRVMLRIDLRDAMLDIVGVAAPTAEDLFVGAAKGQASVVIWMTHVVKMFLRKSYPQLVIDESFLCPSAKCHTITMMNSSKSSTQRDESGRKTCHPEDDFDPCRFYYSGTEFPAVPQSGKQYRGDHCCEADGCWSQLGLGHKLEKMKPKVNDNQRQHCVNCKRYAEFALRSSS